MIREGVFIVPIRSLNTVEKEKDKQILTGFYSTYKVSKPIYSTMQQYRSLVFIVPIRSLNKIFCCINTPLPIGFYSTYKVSKPNQNTKKQIL